MVMADFATKSVFSKASDLSYKHESFTKNDSDEDCAKSLLLVKLQAFIVNCSDIVHDGDYLEIIPINMKALL